MEERCKSISGPVKKWTINLLRRRKMSQWNYLTLNTFRDNCTMRVIKRRPALLELFSVVEEEDNVKTVTSGYHDIRFGWRILSAMDAALFTIPLKILWLSA